MSKVALHTVLAGTYAPMLQSLRGSLDKAADHATVSDINLAKARLAMDLPDLAHQIRDACYYAVDAVSRLAGGSEGKREDVEGTLAGLKSQLQRALDLVHSIPASAFDHAEYKQCTIEMNERLVIRMDANQYVLAWSLPLFYFHVVTAYNILRHKGVDVSTQDYNRQLRSFVRER